MQVNHVINSGFEMFASLFLILNCIQLYKDKSTKGVCLWTSLFFTSWGFWNLYYYPSMGDVCSFVAGVAVTIVNITYCSMFIYYANANRLANHT